MLIRPIGFFNQENLSFNNQIYAVSIVSTNQLSSTYAIEKIINYTLPLNGDDTNGWFAGYNFSQNRINIDFGAPVNIRKISYNNYHHQGGFTWIGAKDFQLLGSNEAAAYSSTSVADFSNLTLIRSGSFLIHTAGNAGQIRDIDLSSNQASYRYLTINILNRHNDTPSVNGLGFRRIFFYN